MATFLRAMSKITSSTVDYSETLESYNLSERDDDLSKITEIVLVIGHSYIEWLSRPWGCTPDSKSMGIFQKASCAPNPSATNGLTQATTHFETNEITDPFAIPRIPPASGSASAPNPFLKSFRHPFLTISIGEWTPTSIWRSRLRNVCMGKKFTQISVGRIHVSRRFRSKILQKTLGE